MFNLKLFTQLQGNNTASLLLRPGQPGALEFFIMSTSINYSIVVSGTCEGELPTMQPLSFDVMLSSIAPLLDKNYNFRLQYIEGHLLFSDVNGKFTVEPLCVEHISDFVVDLTKKYMDFVQVWDSRPNGDVSVEKLRAQLNAVKEEIKQTELMQLSNPFAGSPFGEIPANFEVDDNLSKRVAELEQKIKEVEDFDSKMVKLDFESMRRIINIASRFNTTVSMCDDFAVVDLRTVYILQKCNCGVRAVQGKLLQRLLSEPEGEFFDYRGEVTFVTRCGNGRDTTNIVVFIAPYLPSVTVDKSIVTRGSVQEKYKLNIGQMLKIAGIVSSKFDVMTFDMGSKSLRLSNDNGENITCKFEIPDAQTIELNKAMRGEAYGNIVMSTIDIPKTVQQIMGYLHEEFTIYIKARKIILQSGTLYVVFAR